MGKKWGKITFVTTDLINDRYAKNKSADIEKFRPDQPAWTVQANLSRYFSQFH